jgi:flavin reductase (DIM6/NTAB) family NADH-FMN oxidoreductase RutF
MVEPSEFEAREREFGRALGRVPSGLFVVSAGDQQQPHAMLASWVQQAGFRPPALTVALQPERPIVECIRARKAFCVAILHEASRALFLRFARGVPAGEGPFQGIPTRCTPQGIPYPSAAHGHLECRLLGDVQWSDHVVLCGEIVGGARHDEGEPLVHIRRTGLSY